MHTQLLASRQCGTSAAFSNQKGCVRPSFMRHQMSVAVHASAEPGPLLRRPELKRPEEPASKKLFTEEPAAPVPSVSKPVSVRSFDTTTSGGVSVEFQRQKAKELAKYFQEVRFEEQVENSKVFGWTPENEINNGRWVMMGFAIGLLTEYATSVDFPHQLKLIVQYMGIADLE